MDRNQAQTDVCSRIRERLAAQPTDLPELADRLDVIEALRGLSEGQREVVALHYLADLPVNEIAHTLGIAPGTVKSRLSRGRDALACSSERTRSPSNQAASTGWTAWGLPWSTRTESWAPR